MRLPKLPYKHDALKPYISKEIMELHHRVHHQTCADNYNYAKRKYDVLAKNSQDERDRLEKVLCSNLGGHINHSLFWENLRSKVLGGGKPPSESFRNKIDESFHSYDKFKSQFTEKSIGIVGSGWSWLVYNKLKRDLEITTTANQAQVPDLYVPLLGVDVWEHAYYLDYFSRRDQYLSAIWSVVYFRKAEERLNKLLAKDCCEEGLNSLS
ncbi:hypothetical protein FRC12_011237 [Ceratobasidium sp. 428]|nr:hypothetical protein FRC12_011237 [Ceratobasidium sp. 428]